MPVQVSSTSNEGVAVSTATMYDLTQEQSLEGSYKLEGLEKTRLEEILDMCADYERQIEAEQKEALRLRQNCTPSNVNSERNNIVNNNSDARLPYAGVSQEQSHHISKSLSSKISMSYENGVCHPSTSLNPVTPTSPNGNQWSPGGTMITPNR